MNISREWKIEKIRNLYYGNSLKATFLYDDEIEAYFSKCEKHDIEDIDTTDLSQGTGNVLLRTVYNFTTGELIQYGDY